MLSLDDAVHIYYTRKPTNLITGEQPNSNNTHNIFPKCYYINIDNAAFLLAGLLACWCGVPALISHLLPPGLPLFPAEESEPPIQRLENKLPQSIPPDEKDTPCKMLAFIDPVKE